MVYFANENLLVPTICGYNVDFQIRLCMCHSKIKVSSLNDLLNLPYILFQKHFTCNLSNVNHNQLRSIFFRHVGNQDLVLQIATLKHRILP